MTEARSSDNLNREKKKALDERLEGDHALVHLDSRAEGVVLPAHLMGSEMVTLRVSRLFRGALDVNEDGIVADLRFDGAYFTCRVPFRSVFAISSPDGASAVWTDSAPPEVREKLEAMPSAPETRGAPEPKKPKPGRPPLRRVK